MLVIPPPQPNPNVREYERGASVVFRKTTEDFGGLSNMAGGYPLRVNGLLILTSEALYQACRFPHLPEVQQLILDQASPMTAKMRSKPYRDQSRPDWDRVRVTIMRWCLRVKLLQNWRKFGDLLVATGASPIVEESRKDPFWGAQPQGADRLVGMNVLGRLLMELREEFRTGTIAREGELAPPQLGDLLLLGQPVAPITATLRPVVAAKPKAQAPLFNDTADEQRSATVSRRAAGR